MSLVARLWVAFLYLSCCSATDAADQSSVRVEMGGVQQRRFDRNGKLVAVIGAPRATLDDEGMLVMDDVTATVYREDGKEVSLRASKGKVDTEGAGDAVFEGELEIIFSGMVATTSRATWCESDRTVRGNDEIVVEGRGSRIVGSGFTVFTSEDKVVIYRPRGPVQLEGVKKEGSRNEND